MENTHIILYAEDDPDDVFMVRKAFEKHGTIELVHAGNGEEALLLLNNMLEQGHRPCLVILDINMPVMNGKETLRRIRQDSNMIEVPVVLFSTSSSRTDKDFAEEWNVDLFIKPLNLTDLEIIATRFIEKCHFGINNPS